MGKYSGILLLTDFDGTLFTGREIPQNNIDAIRYFCSEGGLFGFSSGRTYEFFKEFEDIIIPNTCISSVNGTVIYDYPNRKVVSEKFIKENSQGKMLDICRDHENFRNIVIFNRSTVEVIDTANNDDLADQVDTLMSEPVHKVMFHSRVPISDTEKEDIVRFLGDDYYVSRSWAEGIEIQSFDSTKGEAAKAIKNISGAELLVCAGDFENDETMIAAADIGYAVANATEPVKKIADRITVSVGEGAIDAIIDELGSV